MVSVVTNRVVLYVLAAVCFVLVWLLACAGDVSSVVIVASVGVLGTFFTKNLVCIFGLCVTVAALINPGSLGIIDGFSAPSWMERAADPSLTPGDTPVPGEEMEKTNWTGRTPAPFSFMPLAGVSVASVNPTPLMQETQEALRSRVEAFRLGP